MIGFDQFCSSCRKVIRKQFHIVGALPSFLEQLIKEDLDKDRVIKILEDILNKLKNENLPRNDSITRFIFNEI